MDDLWDDDEPVLSPPPRRSRRWRRLLALGLLALALWQLPRVTLIPAVRDWPLRQAFNGIAGQLSSGGADWHWFGPIVYRDVLLETSDGQALLAIDRLTIGRSPLRLVVQPADLGPVTVHGGRLSTAVWQGGSTIETVLAPWLDRLAEPPEPLPAAPAAGQWGAVAAGDQPAAPQPAALNGSLELFDVTVELIDLRHHEAWWITELAATIPLTSAAVADGLPPIDTVVSGRLRQVGQPQLDVRDSPLVRGALPAERRPHWPALGAGRLRSLLPAPAAARLRLEAPGSRLAAPGWRRADSAGQFCSLASSICGPTSPLPQLRSPPATARPTGSLRVPAVLPVVSCRYGMRRRAGIDFRSTGWRCPSAWPLHQSSCRLSG